MTLVAPVLRIAVTQLLVTGDLKTQPPVFHRVALAAGLVVKVNVPPLLSRLSRVESQLPESSAYGSLNSSNITAAMFL